MLMLVILLAIEAQTQAGIFFPPPQSTPIKTVPVNVNVGDSAGDKENSGSLAVFLR